MGWTHEREEGSGDFFGGGREPRFVRVEGCMANSTWRGTYLKNLLLAKKGTSRLSDNTHMEEFALIY